MAYQSASLLVEEGFYLDIFRFAILLPTIYKCLGIARIESCCLKVALAAPLSVGLLALRLAVSLRGLSKWGEDKYLEMKAKLKGASVADIEKMVTCKEDAVTGLRPNLAKGFLWADRSHKKRESLVVVFVHGWSGSRLEVTPLCEQLADSLGANCYFARLPGHGLDMMGNGRENVTCKGFICEIAETLAIAQALGQQVLLVGISTGAALNAWLCAQPWAQGTLQGCVMISANVWTKPVAVVQSIGWIPLFREFILCAVRGGSTTRLTPKNQAHADFATLVYPTHLTSSIFDLSRALALENPACCKVPMLAFHNPDDPRVCYEAAAQFVASVLKGQMIKVSPASDEHQHIITGDALSPSTLPLLLSNISAWMKNLN